MRVCLCVCVKRDICISNPVVSPCFLYIVHTGIGDHNMYWVMAVSTLRQAVALFAGFRYTYEFIPRIISWLCGFWRETTSISPWQRAWLGYICPASSDLVCNEGQRVSPYSPRNHWRCLWKIPPIIAVKSNVTTFIQVLRFLVNMFYCGRVAFTVFKLADIKRVRQRLTSTASLDDRYCEATIPVVKGHHVT